MFRIGFLDDDHRMRTLAQPVEDVPEVSGASRQDDAMGNEVSLFDGDRDVGEPF